MKKIYLQPQLMVETAEVETSILVGSLKLNTVDHSEYNSDEAEEADGGWAPKDNLWEF